MTVLVARDLLRRQPAGVLAGDHELPAASSSRRFGAAERRDLGEGGDPTAPTRAQRPCGMAAKNSAHVCGTTWSGGYVSET